jgi:hypothetical protein
MTPITELLRNVLRKAVLRAYLRELEKQIEFHEFDPGLSARIDCLRFLLGE